MKAKFKTLGLAAAVAAGSLGLANVAQAAMSVSDSGLGDMAIVPYYTVKDNWITGVHIINTTAKTQAVKLRLRRDTDSADVMDINLVMSPNDEWTGYLSDSTGQLRMASDDNTCTVPFSSDASGATRFWQAPNVNSAGAEEGYIEVIAMGETVDEAQVVAKAAVHNSSGVPIDCKAVEKNFALPQVETVGGTNYNIGRVSYTQTNQLGLTSAGAANANLTGTSDWQDAQNDALKVSYFIRDGGSGIEFGNSAVHIEEFLYPAAVGGVRPAAITNQKIGLDALGSANEANALVGYAFPDLNGGAGTGNTGRFATLRGLLGGVSVMNDWSFATARGVSTDWVVTLPGQYLMNDLWRERNAPTTDRSDYRDLPVRAVFNVWNREEQSVVTSVTGVVVSPTPSTVDPGIILNNEVNVIEWGTGTAGSGNSVLGSDPQTGPNTGNAIRYNPAAAGITGEYGWASLAVTKTAAHAQVVCDYSLAGTYSGTVAAATGCADGANTPAALGGGDRGTDVTATNPPLVGFVAWKRSFGGENADRNYGRIIEHSFR